MPGPRIQNPTPALAVGWWSLLISEDFWGDGGRRRTEVAAQYEAQCEAQFETLVAVVTEVDPP